MLKILKGGRLSNNLASSGTCFKLLLDFSSHYYPKYRRNMSSFTRPNKTEKSKSNAILDLSTELVTSKKFCSQKRSRSVFVAHNIWRGFADSQNSSHKTKIASLHKSEEKKDILEREAGYEESKRETEHADLVDVKISIKVNKLEDKLVEEETKSFDYTIAENKTGLFAQLDTIGEDAAKYDEIWREKYEDYLLYLQKGYVRVDTYYHPRKPLKPSQRKHGRFKALLNSCYALCQETYAIVSDIKNRRKDKIIFRTAQILTQAAKLLSEAVKVVIHELLEQKANFGSFKNDVVYWYTAKKALSRGKIDVFKYKEKRRLNRIFGDMLKFIPFSLFIIIPGGELFIPAWVLFFPNSIPSQFVSEKSRRESMERRRALRHEAAEKLLSKLPQYLVSMEDDETLHPVLREELSALNKKLQEGALPTDLLNFKRIFTVGATFKALNSEDLLEIAHFLSLEPVTGIGTINRLLKVFYFPRIPIEGWGVRVITKYTLLRVLNLYFNKIRNDDKAISLTDYWNNSQNELEMICYRRGIFTEDRNKADLVRDLRIWLSISCMANVPNSLLFFTRIVDFLKDRVSPERVMRQNILMERGMDEVFFLEKKKLIEKAIGVDLIEKFHQEIKKKRLSMRIEEIEFIRLFEPGEAEKCLDVFKEFEIRYQALIGSLETSYESGKTMADYIERNIIFDHQMKGEYDILEEKFPELTEKAKHYASFGGEEAEEKVDYVEHSPKKQLLIIKEILEKNPTLEQPSSDSSSKK